MKLTISTQLSNSDLKLVKNILATSSFETVSNYFVYVINNLTNNLIINPIQNARHLISDRTVHSLTTDNLRHIKLSINEHDLTTDFVQDLERSLNTNSFWTISKIFDYAMCQLISNPESTFNFNLNEHDRLVIEGVISKAVLAQLDTLAADFSKKHPDIRKE